MQSTQETSSFQAPPMYETVFPARTNLAPAPPALPKCSHSVILQSDVTVNDETTSFHEVVVYCLEVRA